MKGTTGVVGCAHGAQSHLNSCWNREVAAARVWAAVAWAARVRRAAQPLLWWARQQKNAFPNHPHRKHVDTPHELHAPSTGSAGAVASVGAGMSAAGSQSLMLGAMRGTSARQPGSHALDLDPSNLSADNTISHS